MKFKKHARQFVNLLVMLVVLFGAIGNAPGAAFASPAQPANPPLSAPTYVTIAGSFQSELGCPGDWQPECALTHLAYDSTDDVWQASFTIPAGSYEYKAALDDSWTTSYPASNIAINLPSNQPVKFYYDDKTNVVEDSYTKVIATAPGDFQSELGCSGDWQPDCLRTWLTDPDGDGTYTFTTTALPVGTYLGKIAINEGWSENYGDGGVSNGSNVGFTVAAPGSTLTISYNSSTHVPTFTVNAPVSSLDNNVEWNGLKHDSRDTLYRTPGGAVPAGTPVTLRLRTFHNDVSSVKVRIYDNNLGGQVVRNMTVTASDVDCYQADLTGHTCDFWSYTLDNAAPDNLWYRFIIADGTSTAYYADNTAALDGGLGAPTSSVVDNSYALMVYDPAFSAPAWAKDAVMYQVFTDRFRNGDTANDPVTNDARYDDPVVKLPWNTKPEGFCRNYADGATNCPWRFDSTPPAWSPTKESPRGRDYMGGDLKGVDAKLDYLVSLGVNTIYFNPVFDLASNHGYDTQDYYKIDPYFGTQADWDKLVTDANAKGIRIVLDGVFNHMSSDSPFFDRYHHFTEVGACESASSPYRSWFHFRAPTGTEVGVCAPSTPGGTDTYYDGWFGFDSIPVLTKTNAQVQDYFIHNADSVTKHWLNAGASGWRLDVMGDSSFPAGYWEDFRSAVKTTDPNALIIGELWQKDNTLMSFLTGDRADSVMNYRLRDAVIGFLAPGAFDSKGFGDSGRVIAPSEFASRLASIQEDYPAAAYYSSMNLLDSHDTERLLWTLTPGSATTLDKEGTPANLAAGKNAQMLASLIQFTLPGAPTVYYGDEAALTGADDPDDRRTYPWADTGGTPDASMLAHYTSLAAARKANPALVSGDLAVLLADDANGTVAYGRKTTAQAALVVINRSASARTVTIPLSGYIPDGVSFSSLLAVGNTGTFSGSVTSGNLTVNLDPKSAWILATANPTDLNPPAAPGNLTVTTEGSNQLDVSWDASGGAASYNVYISPLSGGGYKKDNLAPVTGTSYTFTGLTNARNYYIVVTAVDANGNESGHSNEVVGMPHLTIGWANLQWPPTLLHTISTTTRTGNIYGQVWINGATDQPGVTPGLIAQVGYAPAGSQLSSTSWVWVDASFNGQAGNNDEFVTSLLPESTGSFNYIYRYSTTAGREWLYADNSGPMGPADVPINPGVLTVIASADTTNPAVPANLVVSNASPAAIVLGWDAVTGDLSLDGYEVLRADASGGPYTSLGRTTSVTYTDTTVVQGATYYYVVRAVDTSFNRSGYSNEVTAVALPRKVSLDFNVTVPSGTDLTGRSVYIAGFMDRLDGGLPQWDPAGVVLTKVNATHWNISLTGDENTQIEYKYTLGSWDFVEKDAACGEIGNRSLTLTYGSTGTQTVNDSVLAWRNAGTCNTSTFTVSGTLGALGAGATVSFTGGTPVTASSTGSYSFSVPYGWIGSITPALNGYVFSSVSGGKPSITITGAGVTADLPGQDFTTSRGFNITASGAPTVKPGGSYVYTFAYTNKPALNLAVATISLPIHASYDSSSVPCAASSGVVTCDLGNLSADGAGSFTLTVQIDRLKKIGLPLTLLSANYSISGSGLTPFSGQNTFSAETLSPFADVPVTHPLRDEIQSLWAAGFTNGCWTPAGPSFCPDTPVSRGELAVFLGRAIHGPKFDPGVLPITFTDTALNPYRYWIEQFKLDGISNGCGAGRFCPGNAATRAQMTVLLLKSYLGPSYIPPAATGKVFKDIPASAFAANWIEKLYSMGITQGCGFGNFCPDRNLSRAETAAFIRRTFKLQLPTP